MEESVESLKQRVKVLEEALGRIEEAHCADGCGTISSVALQEKTALNHTKGTRLELSHETLLDIVYRVLPYLEDLIEDAGGEEGPGRYYKSPALKALLTLVKDGISQAEALAPPVGEKKK